MKEHIIKESPKKVKQKHRLAEKDLKQSGGNVAGVPGAASPINPGAR